jgi:hypothetical protein
LGSGETVFSDHNIELAWIALTQRSASDSIGSRARRSGCIRIGPIALFGLRQVALAGELIVWCLPVLVANVDIEPLDFDILVGQAVAERWQVVEQQISRGRGFGFHSSAKHAVAYA